MAVPKTTETRCRDEAYNPNPIPTSFLTLGACAARVTVVVLCVCLSISPQAILAVRAITSKTKDAIVLNVEFEAKI